MWIYFKSCLVCSLPIFLALGCHPKSELPQDVQDRLTGKQSIAENNVTTGVRPSNNDQATDAAETQPQQPTLEQFNVDEEAPWIASSQLPWEYAESIYVGNTRIGFASTSVTSSEVTEFRQLHIKREEVIDRGTDGNYVTPTRTTLETFERLNGSLTGFRFESIVDQQPETRIDGRQRNNQIEITWRDGEESAVRSKLAWNRDFWGPHGVLQILMRAPMKPGENRTTSIFVPKLKAYLPVLLQARQIESTSTAQGGDIPLLRIDLTVQTADGPIRSILYVDEQGVIQKTLSGSEQISIKLRIEPDVLQRLRDQAEFVLRYQAQLPMEMDLSQFADAKKAVFLVESREVDPYDILLDCNRQSRKSLSPSTCGLTCYSTNQTELGDEFANQASDLASSTLIPADNAFVIELAADFLAGEPINSETEKSELICRRLHAMFEIRSMEPEIGSTLVALRAQTGSCIEVANILAALLRSQQIPVQLVCGLRADREHKQWRIHTWNRAWADGRWLDLDATSGNRADTGYISMRIESGNGSNPYAQLLPVLRQLSNIMSIDALSVDDVELERTQTP